MLRSFCIGNFIVLLVKMFLNMLVNYYVVFTVYYVVKYSVFKNSMILEQEMREFGPSWTTLYTQFTHEQLSVLYSTTSWLHPGLSRGFVDIFKIVQEICHGQINR